TRALIASGLAIAEVNAVRQAITEASGGRLAAIGEAAAIDVIVVSDVIGDDLAVIGSGPFASRVDPHRAAALAAAVPAIPQAARAAIARAAAHGGEGAAPRRDHVRHHLVATPACLCARAIEAAEARGLRVVHLPPATEDVVAVAERLASLSLSPREIAVGVGEPTVRLPVDHGLGG